VIVLLEYAVRVWSLMASSSWKLTGGVAWNTIVFASAASYINNVVYSQVPHLLCSQGLAGVSLGGGGEKGEERERE
jgi:hypothetical protein